MDIRYVFMVFSGVLMVMCYFPYIRAIIRKKSIPMKATWFIWVCLDIATAAGMYADNKLNVQISCAVIGASIVFLLSLWYGESKWTVIDVMCLYVCLFGIVLWWAYDSPLLAILASSFGNVVGSVPTWRSVWQDYRRENKSAWLLATGSSLCSLVAMEDFSPISFSQPMAFLTIQLTTLYIIFVRAAVPTQSAQSIEYSVM